MARRTLKPFTVEIRKGGRKAVPPTVSWPTDPTLDSAPNDRSGPNWPGLGEPPQASLVATETVHLPKPSTGRVLPVVAEIELPPEMVAVRRATRRRAKSIDDATLPAKASSAALDISEAPIQTASQDIGTTPVHARMIDAVRQARERLPRSAFKRGERWKSRLPYAVHRASRRRGYERDA